MSQTSLSFHQEGSNDVEIWIRASEILKLITDSNRVIRATRFSAYPCTRVLPTGQDDTTFLLNVTQLYQQDLQGKLILL